VSSTKPSAPRLDPLGSPGPVTPLALEEEGGYLAAGEMNGSNGSMLGGQAGGPPPELVEKLIQRESERIASQKSGRKENKGR
jgi:hypothetical protein